jgi:hypothetical protein
MSRVFLRKTNFETITGLPVFKTITGKLVTKKGTPVEQHRGKYITENNRNIIRGEMNMRGGGSHRLNTKGIANWYINYILALRNYNKAHPKRSPKRSPSRSPSRNMRRIPGTSMN